MRALDVADASDASLMDLTSVRTLRKVEHSDVVGRRVLIVVSPRRRKLFPALV